MWSLHNYYIYNLVLHKLKGDIHKMVRQNLNGIWRMRRCDTQDWIKGTVPGSVFNDLLNAGRIEDPFYRDNEDQAKIIASYDYEYTRD